MNLMRYIFVLPTEDYNGDPYTVEEYEAIIKLLNLRFGRVIMHGVHLNPDERASIALWGDNGEVAYQNITEASVLHSPENPQAVVTVTGMIATILREKVIDVIHGPVVSRAYALGVNVDVANTIGYSNGPNIHPSDN